MRRFREGYIWNDISIGMTSYYDDGLVIVPVDKDGQLMFRFFINERK